MDMNGTVNQRDSINYNWPLLAVTQGLVVTANTLITSEASYNEADIQAHVCAHKCLHISAKNE